MLSSGGSLSSTPDNTLFQRMDNSQMQVKPQNSASSRILDIPCRVCGDFSSGKHYNIFACDGCAGFFKRSIRRDRKYTCKAKDVGSCVIDKVHRNQCRACRLKRCEEAGMNKDAVQHERGPRNSTLKKQQLTYITEANARLMLATPQSNVLNLTMGRTPSPPQNPPRAMDSVLHLLPHPSFFYHSPPLSRFSSPPTLPPTPPMFPQPSTSPSEDSTLPVVCESAARMLFLNVQWMRTVPAYVTLPMQDQVQLLEHAWRDMFVLSIAQCLPLLDLTGPYFSRRITNPVVLREARDFQEIVNKLKQMLLDPHEYQLLRHVILFRATTNLEDRFNRPELNNLLERTRILQLQDEHLTNLNNYIMSAHKEQPMRFTKLMMILPHMKRVTDFLIEELFFRKTIGPIPITNIMCDMYRNHVLGLPMI